VTWCWEKDVSVNNNRLVFNKHAIGMVVVSIKNGDFNAFLAEKFAIILVLFTGEVNVGWARSKIAGKRLRIGVGNTADQSACLLVQPYGCHGCSDNGHFLTVRLFVVLIFR
jgi:hypothetical protein